MAMVESKARRLLGTLQDLEVKLSGGVEVLLELITGRVHGGRVRGQVSP